MSRLARILLALGTGLLAAAAMFWFVGWVLIRVVGLNDPGPGGGLLTLAGSLGGGASCGVVAYRAMAEKPR